MSQALLALHSLPPATGSYGRDQAVLNWSDQGLLLAGFARSRGLVVDEWLAAGRVRPGQALSCADLLRLISPLLGLGRDAPFVLGQLWLPGHYGLASQALSGSASVLQSAERLGRYTGRLLPLMTPRPLQLGDRFWLLFTESCGLPAPQRAALVDLHLAAFVGFCNWRAGRRLPWAAHFNRTAPRDLGTHAAMLTPQLQFDCQVDALSLPLALAREVWGLDERALLAEPLLADGLDAQALRRGWLAWVQEAMLAQLARDGASQEALAQQLGISLATLKRQFAAHGTHWQAELDTLRARLALALLREPGWTSARVSSALGFGHAANFRRSLRRWTGAAA